MERRNLGTSFKITTKDQESLRNMVERVNSSPHRYGRRSTD
jgi:hypothetical protein